ncbi:MAG TPA: hypothetical protein VG371_16425 [Solirubrobacteraceae bacterium]|jgi:hypothetical protein|nr:hypothetical protein [Solirubrobacteraceae bacterium]
MSDDPLDAARWESMERMSGYIARTHPAPARPDFGYLDKYEAALDALVEYMAERGWPDGQDFKPMMAFAGAAVNRAYHESVKHLAHASFWARPPANEDSLGEKITDRIGVHQLCHAFTESEWQAVWALAEAIRRGGDYRDAAASIGLGDAAFTQRLYLARKRAFQLWVAPGETPRGRYAPMAGAHRSRLHHALEERRRQERLRQEPA